MKLSSFATGTMEEPKLRRLVEDIEEANSTVLGDATHQSLITQNKSQSWWILVLIFILFVLFAQSGATLLGRLYYNKGGKSIWLSALLETIGFPILIPIAYYLSRSDSSYNITGLKNTQSVFNLVLVNIFIGILQAAANLLYAIGLLHLSVSTFSLICATQLGFQAFFSFFLNEQKLTPPLLNSLVLLSLSSAILVFSNHSENPTKTLKAKESLGFSCTLIASALYALMLSLTQLSFQKLLKRKTIAVVFNMIICQSLAASSVITAMLFATGEWKKLKNDMENFELGRPSYLLIIVSVAVAWQICTIGAVGLIFEVSSLFSNIISTVDLPIVPVLATIVFHDKMDGLKVISIVLAAWGFASFVYQNYLDNYKSRIDNGSITEVQEATPKE